MDELIRFTRNHHDLSTDRGFQWDFFCDGCGNGYRSPYEPNVASTVSDVLHGASNLLGGIFGRVGDAAYDIKRAVGGKAHDNAFRRAVEACRPHFRQCGRCGKWVCPEVCWNEERGLCTDCAPKLAHELAKIQTEVQAVQIREKAHKTNLIPDVDMATPAVATCPQCGAETTGGKFCPDCGAHLNPKVTCGQCGAQVPAEAKFCPDCGAPRGG